MAGVLYAPAGAVMTVWFGERRAHAPTAITLRRGLASTVLAPTSRIDLDEGNLTANVDFRVVHGELLHGCARRP